MTTGVSLIPTHYTMTSTMPKQPGPNGLNYYIHAAFLPTKTLFSRVLEQVHAVAPSMGGAKTIQILKDNLSDLEWHCPLSGEQRDRLGSLGYNYVGLLGDRLGIWHSDVICDGYHKPLMSVLTFTEILIGLELLNHEIALKPHLSKLQTLLSGLEALRARLPPSKVYEMDWLVTHDHKLYMVIKPVNTSARLDMYLPVENIDSPDWQPLWHQVDTHCYYDCAVALQPRLQKSIFTKVVLYA